VTTEGLDTWAADFAAFHARFAPYFCRREPREAAQRYLRGLLSPVQRKNAWQMAEAVGLSGPQSLQRLLNEDQWDPEAVLAELQTYVVEEFGDPEAIAVLDESAFVKKGLRSVGVQRQWCSTLGKRENCQVGVFLTYVSSRGSAFLDRRLYLPEDWAEDPARRQAAKVPTAIPFQTKGQLGQAMLERAWERGIPMRWVTGDEAYGQLPYLRDRIAQEGLGYVLAVPSNTAVWPQRPPVEAPGTATGTGAGARERPRTQVRLAAGAPPSVTVAAVVATWPARKWHRAAVAAGEKGPRTYDWGACRVVISRESLPGEELWLLTRRSLSPPHELAYYLSNAPPGTPWRKLAEVASARWRVEQCFEEGKGEAGLDEYEVRYWHSWHRHMTLSLLAHSWLMHLRRQEQERQERGAGEKGAPRRPSGPATGHGPSGGRSQRRGSEAAPGSRAAPSTPDGGVQACLVGVAALPAAAGSQESLSVRGLSARSTLPEG
jgi:SRSO17 transposase